MREQESTTTLPGVLATISAGFDLTAKHLWLLFIPVVLDVFYWLGPRLRFQVLIKQLITNLPPEAEVLDLATQLTSIAPQTNLFTTLSVQLIGVPALMLGLTPETTPMVPDIVEIESWSSWFGLFLIFSIVGLFLTALFYTFIAYAISNRTPTMAQMSTRQWGNRVLSSWARLIGLVVIFLIMTLILYIPLVIIGSILFLLNATLGSLTMLIGPFLMVWVVFALSMAPFGIVLNGRPVLKAVAESARIVQTQFPSILLLLITVVFVGVILDWLLIAVENGTWFTLINIVGHAFVSTALIAALFIFYRDRYLFLFEPQSAIEVHSKSGNEK